MWRAPRDGVARAFVLAGDPGAGGGPDRLLLRRGTRIGAAAADGERWPPRWTRGDLHPRIETAEGEAIEIGVLADAFNHMLDRLTEAFAGQRAFIADASHELRTPLTVIRGQLEVLAAQEHPSAQEVRRVEALVRAEMARVSRLVDDLLLLASSEQPSSSCARSRSSSTPTCEELWDGMTLLAERRFELGPLPRGTLMADRDRLAQALRNLISNAINHTSPEQGLVR